MITTKKWIKLNVAAESCSSRKQAKKIIKKVKKLDLKEKSGN